MGEVLPMDDKQLEVESRSVFALMDGLQLQWLLDPSIDAAQAFEIQLDALVDQWHGAVPARPAKHRAARYDAQSPTAMTRPR